MKLAKIRERHHTVARLLATGYRPGKVAALTGYSNSRISVLQADPMFKELVAFYSDREEEDFDRIRGHYREAVGEAVGEIKRRLGENPEKISTSELLKIATDFGDRTGHGPMSTVKQVNIHANMAEMLDEGRKRAKAAAMERRGVTIEGEAVGL